MYRNVVTNRQGGTHSNRNRLASGNGWVRLDTRMHGSPYLAPLEPGIRV